MENDEDWEREFDRHFLGTDDHEWSKNDIINGTWSVYAYAVKKWIRNLAYRYGESTAKLQALAFEHGRQKGREEVQELLFQSGIFVEDLKVIHELLYIGIEKSVPDEKEIKIFDGKKFRELLRELK